MFSGIIRELNENDLPAVEQILDLYWSGEFRKHLSERLHIPPVEQNFIWYIAEENGEVVGVAASREAPERMKKYTKTDKVVEFYVAAAKYKGRGIGTALRNMRIEDARKEGYAEAVFFSGDAHQDSWAFHDNSEFRRVGEMISPNGEKGRIWIMDLQ
jgi:L-amino acid N-acyltransferase YncA